ncbi:hypothetical protein F444_01922 [Phytophthora nicotianae P1976]|uniref:Uncharacterized protein n=1 Tax=Phytophthora nicotianae P1976 TaxID=1317066 RepID=A0A081AZ23_PHYNI|nr:hypothetical protein F444_01922 [Phytophthora nicotianae P1976]
MGPKIRSSPERRLAKKDVVGANWSEPRQRAVLDRNLVARTASRWLRLSPSSSTISSARAAKATAMLMLSTCMMTGRGSGAKNSDKL